MVEAYILSVGENLPCFVIGQSSITIHKATDNLSDLNNVATITLGHLINSAEIDTELEVPENLVGKYFLFGVLYESCFHF